MPPNSPQICPRTSGKLLTGLTMMNQVGGLEDGYVVPDGGDLGVLACSHADIQPHPMGLP